MTALRNVTLTYNLLKPRRIFLFKEPQCFLFNHTQDSLGLLLLQLICQFLGKIDVLIYFIFFTIPAVHIKFRWHLFKAGAFRRSSYQIGVTTIAGNPCKKRGGVHILLWNIFAAVRWRRLGSKAMCVSYACAM